MIEDQPARFVTVVGFALIGLLTVQLAAVAAGAARWAR